MVELVMNSEILANRVVWLHSDQLLATQKNRDDILWQTIWRVMQDTIPQTAVWVAVSDPVDKEYWRVAQAKIAAYDVTFDQYPQERSRMHGGDAARLVRRWGHELPPEHPACDCLTPLRRICKQIA
jgi:hypothetical protein